MVGSTLDLINVIYLCSFDIHAACPAGEYGLGGDSTCQQCPGNTVMDVEAAPVCECLPGYFRNDVNLVTASGAQTFLNSANEGPGTACTSKLFAYITNC